jgi:hypothetical protein
MKKIKSGELVSDFTSKKSQELNELKEILLDNVDSFGIKWRTHLPVFLGPSETSRILWFDYLIQQITEVPGVVIEFGSQWGSSLSTINNLLQIHDPWNASRILYSFSTFEDGFKSVDDKDGKLVASGDYATSGSWKDKLDKVLLTNSISSPIGQLCKIIEGDACETFKSFLENNPHIIVSLAHFDFDIYKPTKEVLELVISKMPKGSLLVFDELNHPGFPGETLALNETLGIMNLRLKKSKYQPYSAFVVIE